MAKLIIDEKTVKRIIKKTQTETTSTIKIVVCSDCKETVYAPPNGIVYNHCYNCGAKFDAPVSYKTIKALKNKQEKYL